MKQYDFTLKFALGQPDADPEKFVARLEKEGCDDALIGIGKRGQIALDFSREANSADEAVLSALKDVKRAIPDATFVEAAPDFVGVPDIAKLLGVSRQYIGKFITPNAKDFPPAVFGNVRSIWHLENVLVYLVDQNIRQVDDALIEVARVNMWCNQAREQHRLAAPIPESYLQATG